MYSLNRNRIWVAGHRGMVGAAVMRRLQDENCEVLIADRSQVDLRDQVSVREWINRERPHSVVLAAARVGGILANVSSPADFIYDNLMIAANVIDAAARAGVEKLLFLGSSCIYPRDAGQPIKEEALLTGALEPTNEPYAIAKIAGIKLCQSYRRQHGCDFVVAMPPNLYGPGDNYHPDNSHVLAGLLRRAHEAKRDGASELTVWGSGTPRREFLHVDDLADGLVFLMQHYSDALPINIGSGADVSIRRLADMICTTVGFIGELRFDTSKPDGTPRKVMDVSRVRSLGWQPQIPLEQGLADAYADYLSGGGRG